MMSLTCKGGLICRKLPGFNLVSLALNSSLDDIQTYASKAGLNSKKLGFELFPIVRNALLKAALRTLEHE